MKKGFTIIEIILSIGLIVLIGTVSLVSFNLVKKNKKINTLNNMSEEIYNAVNLYVETNNDVKNELYENNNGIKIPLTTLANAGLVDFQDLELDEEDYVVTMLGSEEADDDHCASTYTAKSWNLTSGETIYICEKSNGTQNLVTVAGDADNLSKVTREVYYFKGDNPSNYIQLKGNTENTYRILSVDKDDSLVLVTGSSNTNFTKTTFSNNTMPIYGLSAQIQYSTISFYFDTGLNEWFLLSADQTKSSTYGGKDITTDNVVYINIADFSHSLSSNGYHDTTSCPSGLACTGYYNSYLGIIEKHYYTNIFPNYKKIHLKPCMKIISGTGDIATPYILENKC